MDPVQLILQRIFVEKELLACVKQRTVFLKVCPEKLNIFRGKFLKRFFKKTFSVYFINICQKDFQI